MGSEQSVAGQRYRCPQCGSNLVVPRAPSRAPETIRAGCPDCGRIRRLLKSGGVASTMAAWRGEVTA